jgi:hypothetical protein
VNEQDILTYQTRQNEFIDLLKSSQSHTSQNFIREDIVDEEYELLLPL